MPYNSVARKDGERFACCSFGAALQ